MKNRLSFFTLLLVFPFFSGIAQQDSLIDSLRLPAEEIAVAMPDTVELEAYTLTAQGDELLFQAEIADGIALIELNGERMALNFNAGKAVLNFPTDEKGALAFLRTEQGGQRLYHAAERSDGSTRLRHIPLWLSILPPLIAILLALIFREVIISLFAGIWVGAFIAGGMRIESLYYLMISVFEVVQKYVVNALYDSGHLSIIVFSLLIGGMVAIISRNGGMAGVVQSLSRYAKSARSSQFITWVLGVAIFFDDYANTLIVGNTMRSVTDKYRVSREKLAYIVDSTAAPVAAIAFITTWIGAELGYIDDGLKNIEDFTGSTTPYAIFINSLKYSFYPVMTLGFILMLIYMRKDYGSMYVAEVRARQTGQVAPARSETETADLEDLSPVKNAPLKWYNAAIPVLVVVFMTLLGLLHTGMANTYAELIDAGVSLPNHSWSNVWSSMGTLIEGGGSFFTKLGKLVGNSDSYVALLWASVSGVIAAIALTIGARIMKISDTMATLTTGIKTMLPAIIILIMAWSLASTTEELHTAEFLTSALKDSVNPYLMPVFVFILAAAISFSTGSSWSTMAILYPIAIPTTWAICLAQGIPADLSMEILLNCIAVVLAASVLGDHCSPISDTTILSSLASDCNHIDHVRTQMPYALTVGAVSMTAGGLATFFGGGWLVCTLLLLLGFGVLFLVVHRFGKKVE
ncbi:MAG TPA: Na+/H+ antiporter NhaC family protein [Saprospiraceae bacterium]|nr:Na+/H+ antiporter NhaC family protein [Saprospiraceae bacterium]